MLTRFIFYYKRQPIRYSRTIVAKNKRKSNATKGIIETLTIIICHEICFKSKRLFFDTPKRE